MGVSPHFVHAVCAYLTSCTSLLAFVVMPSGQRSTHVGCAAPTCSHTTAVASHSAAVRHPFPYVQYIHSTQLTLTCCCADLCLLCWRRASQAVPQLVFPASCMHVCMHAYMTMKGAPAPQRVVSLLCGATYVQWGVPAPCCCVVHHTHSPGVV